MYNWREQEFDFPNPDVPSARHGPTQNQGFHFSGSSGFVYEVWLFEQCCTSAAIAAGLLTVLAWWRHSRATYGHLQPLQDSTACPQAAAVHSAVVNGWNEMDDMPLSDTLALAKTLDRIRWQVGLIYPQDREP